MTAHAPPELLPYQLLSVTQAAIIGGIERTTLYRAIQDDHLKCHEVGRSKRLRVSYADLQTYLSKLRR